MADGTHYYDCLTGHKENKVLCLYIRFQSGRHPGSNYFFLSKSLKIN